jgi:hypothetical protein
MMNQCMLLDVLLPDLGIRDVPLGTTTYIYGLVSMEQQPFHVSPILKEHVIWAAVVALTVIGGEI